MNETVTCIVCARELWEDELGRYACKPCERRIDDRLAAIAGPYGLYARLCLRMEPGAHTGGEIVSGSSSPSIPANLQILDLTASGGLIGTLESWVEDWASCGLAARGTGGRLQHRIDQAIGTLRLNLPRAVERHPALDEFTQEIDRIYRTAKALVDDGRESPQVPGTCIRCGKGFRYDLFADSASCPHCEHRHTKAQLLQPDRARETAA